MLISWASFWGVMLAVFAAVLRHEWNKDHPRPEDRT